MNILPDSMLVLAACIAALAVCILIFAVALKIALKIRSLKAKFTAMGASALYVLSPIDLFPDVVPIIGQADDAGALAAFIGLAVSLYSDFKKAKEKRNAHCQNPDTPD